jgi:hypothetical protein
MLYTNLDRDTGYPDWGFCDFCQNLRANAGIVPLLGHDSLLRNPLNSLVMFYPKLYSLGNENFIK